MSHRNESFHGPATESTRPALIDLVSRHEAAAGAGGLFSDERGLLAALQEIISRGQQPAARLFGEYHSDPRDNLGRFFAEYD